MRPRPKGAVVYRSPENPAVKEAEANQRQERLRLQTERAERREERYRTMPNQICYADTAFKDWTPDMPIPKCLKCRGKLYPEEHHDCPSFIPKYRTDGLSRDERMEKRKAGWDDWDDDQYDPTTPGDGADRMQHEAETGETYDQVVIEGMTEEDYLMEKFGYIPSLEDFEE